MLSCKNDDTTYALSPALNRMVHIDSVQRGLSCSCVCPGCGEPMIANQGEHNKHYFSHERKPGAQHDLQKCYMSAMHRLAEQILVEKKMVMLPSYYKIFGSRRMMFDRVEVEERHDRTDMQPDIVGITTDGKRYLIEILFSHAIDENKRKKIYADNLTCVEIDISNQRMNDLEDFLLNQDCQRKWINNKYAFEAIEERYRQNGKSVHVLPTTQCIAERKDKYCSALVTSENRVHRIYHCGKSFIICKRTHENCILEKSSAESEVVEERTPSHTSAPIKKENFSSTWQVRVPKCGLCEKGDESTYPCHPGFLFTSLEDYYKRIKPSVVFCQKNGTRFEVLNHFRAKTSFAVVLASTGTSFTYCVVIVSKEDVFEHRWYYPFDDEMKATFAAKELLKIL